MKDKHKVLYTVKHLDVNTPSLYGLIIERKSTFDSFLEAVEFARQIRGTSKNGVTVLGTPTVVRA